jgi:molybdopterin converting factor small subunit
LIASGALDDFEDIDQKSHFPPPRANTNTVNNQQTTTAISTSNVNNNSNNNTTNSNQPGDANKEYGAPLEDTEKLVEEFQRDMGKVLEELQGPDFMKALDEMAKKMQEEEKKMDGNVPQSNTPSNNNNNNSSSSGDPKLTEEEEIQKKLQETLKMLTENVKKMEVIIQFPTKLIIMDLDLTNTYRKLQHNIIVLTKSFRKMQISLLMLTKTKCLKICSRAWKVMTNYQVR